VDTNPQDYTVWFPIALKELKTHLIRARRG